MTPIDIERILRILPQRWPFVLVDRVTELVPQSRIAGHKCVTIGEIWFQGHFTSRPVMPGVLVVESLAQIGCVLAYASEPFDASTSLMYFLGIDKAKFRRAVIPGDRLDLDVEIVDHSSNVWKFKGNASVDGALCVSAEFLASIVDRSV